MAWHNNFIQQLKNNSLLPLPLLKASPHIILGFALYILRKIKVSKEIPRRWKKNQHEKKGWN